MNNEELKKHFDSRGARLKFQFTDGWLSWRGQPISGTFTIDVNEDRKGEYFEIVQNKNAPDFEILQTLPKERHLLLYCKDGQRFLCGHDERHWFVSGIEDRVSTIREAKQSLLPKEILGKTKSFSPKKIDNRRNAVFTRQGEWFFVPTDREFSEKLIFKNEGLMRSAWNKAHECEELVRFGGELVYLVGDQEFTERKYKKKKKENPSFDPGGPKTMIRNPEVYVRGYIRHEDHATIKLDCWHRVFINSELTTSSVSFLD